MAAAGRVGAFGAATLVENGFPPTPTVITASSTDQHARRTDQLQPAARNRSAIAALFLRYYRDPWFSIMQHFRSQQFMVPDWGRCRSPAFTLRRGIGSALPLSAVSPALGWPLLELAADLPSGERWRVDVDVVAPGTGLNRSEERGIRSGAGVDGPGGATAYR
jgi:hypothetical protein